MQTKTHRQRRIDITVTVTVTVRHTAIIDTQTHRHRQTRRRNSSGLPNSVFPVLALRWPNITRIFRAFSCVCSPSSVPPVHNRENKHIPTLPVHIRTSIPRWEYLCAHGFVNCVKARWKRGSENQERGKMLNKRKSNPKFLVNLSCVGVNMILSRTTIQVCHTSERIPETRKVG